MDPSDWSDRVMNEGCPECAGDVQLEYAGGRPDVTVRCINSDRTHDYGQVPGCGWAKERVVGDE